MSASVLPAAMRSGDFSALLAQGASSNIQLYDTQNNFASYAGDQGLPVLNPGRRFSPLIQIFIPCPMRRRQTGCCRTTTRARNANSWSTTRAT